MTRIIPASWMPDVPMERVILHWTAGTYTPNATDKKAYHALIDGDGRPHRGVASIEKNSGFLKPGYAAHTLNCNTDSISLSQCCMGGAKESPFDAGRWPMKEQQMISAIEATADFCEHYRIPVTPKTVLTHAEVQANLGIRQRNKWDYTRLAFAPDVVGARKIGDMIRARVSDLLAGKKEAPVVSTKPTQTPAAPPVAPAVVPAPAGGVGVVDAKSGLIMRRTPDGERMGALPDGTQLVIQEPSPDGLWLKVTTPAGYTGWVSREYVDIVDGPPAADPTTPNPLRAKIDEIRRLADELEQLLDL